MAHLKDCRVLIVEDNPLIGLDIAALLRDAGCRVVGPFASASSAIQAVGEGGLDAAVLGIDLNGEKAFCVAEALELAGVPFVWLTGYSRCVVPEQFRDRPILSKPVVGRALIRQLSILLQRT